MDFKSRNAILEENDKDKNKGSSIGFMVYLSSGDKKAIYLISFLLMIYLYFINQSSPSLAILPIIAILAIDYLIYSSD